AATFEKSLGRRAGFNRRMLAFPAMAAVALVSGFAIGRSLSDPGPPQPLQFIPLVANASLKLFPAWSPNGKPVPYAGEVKGILQIFTQTIGASRSTQITHQSNDCFRPFWAPNGERIYYLAFRGREAVSFEPRLSRDVWSVGAAGGTPELVSEGAAAAAISPDG